MEGKGISRQPFDKKDCWDMKWSADSPSKMCFCEKMRMYMLDNMVPSPAILS
jgi:hypothetical protein